jgi:hypothetical protein
MTSCDTSQGGQDWTLPAGFTAEVSAEDAATVKADVDAALAAAGFRNRGDPATAYENLSLPNAKVRVNDAAVLPDEKHANWWGIKCNTMYDKCSGSKCGLTLTIARTRKYYDYTKFQQDYNAQPKNCPNHHVMRPCDTRYNCDMVWNGISTMIKIGVLDVPDSGTFTMPSHGKLVEGFVTRLADENFCMSTWCTNNKKQEFLAEVDVAVRAGLAKARFKIAKRISAKIANLRL